MIAVDTNIIVRFFAGDDDAQLAVSRLIIEYQPILVTDSVFLEVEWVLRFSYQFDVQSIIGAFRKLLGLPNVYVRISECVVSDPSQSST